MLVAWIVYTLILAIAGEIIGWYAEPGPHFVDPEPTPPDLPFWQDYQR